MTNRTLSPERMERVMLDSLLGIAAVDYSRDDVEFRVQFETWVAEAKARAAAEHPERPLVIELPAL